MFRCSFQRDSTWSSAIHYGPTSSASIIVLVLLFVAATSTGFQPRVANVIPEFFHKHCETRVYQPTFLLSDDWSSFQSLDDDDEIVYGKMLDKQEYAGEKDSQSVKEAVGVLRSSPVIERDAQPINVVAGK
jgi:hypothetical protein